MQRSLRNRILTLVAMLAAILTSATSAWAVAQLLVERTPGPSQGNLTLINSTASSIGIVGYSITSTAGALDQNPWTTIDGNYDVDGNGSVDIDDHWTALTAPGPFAFDLSEFEFDGGGGTLAAGQMVDLGNAWIANDSESDIAMTLKLLDGSNLTVLVEFVGNDGNSFTTGDLDTDGDLDAVDWNLFKAGFEDATLASLPPAIAYSFGDLDRDGDNDVFDFRSFKKSFNALNGAGAFEAMVAGAPEPGTFALVTFVGIFFCSTRGRRFRNPANTLGLLTLVAGLCGLLNSPQALAADITWGAPTAISTGPGNSSDVVFGDVVEAYSAVTPSSPLAGATVSVNGVEFLPTTDLLPGSLDAGGLYSSTTDGGDLIYDMLLDSFEYGGGGSLFNVTIGDGDGNTSIASSGLLTPGEDYQIQIWFVDDRFNRVMQFGDGNGNTVLLGDEFAVGTFTADATTQVLSMDAQGFGNAHITAYSILSEVDLPTLTVNTVTGEVSLTNITDTAFEIDFYQLKSASGSLDVANWRSLESQDFAGIGFPDGDGSGNGWEELGTASSNALSEAFLTGSSSLGNGTTISLGNAFDTLGIQDLELTLGLPTGALITASVEEIAELSADFDADGDVDGNDLTDSLLGWNARYGKELIGSDFLAWQRQLGLSLPSASAATVVPEPSALVCCGIAPLVLVVFKRNWLTRSRVIRGVSQKTFLSR